MIENVLMFLGARHQKEELGVLERVNEDTASFGLSLTGEEASALIVYRNEALVKHQRVEFGKGILDQIIYAFCDSQYLQQEEYLETLEALVDAFYEFKNASFDELSDEELLTFMKEQFELVCFGDVEYLQGTCLERFGKAIRSGYQGYRYSQGRGEYEDLSEEARWDKDTYMSVLKELFW